MQGMLWYVGSKSFTEAAIIAAKEYFLKKYSNNLGEPLLCFLPIGVFSGRAEIAGLEIEQRVSVLKGHIVISSHPDFALERAEL